MEGKKALGPLGPRERRLALAASLLIGCWLLVGWVVGPLWERIQAVQTRTQANREKIEALTRLLEQAGTTASGYRREVVGYVESASQEGAAGEALLQELEALSRSSGVQVDLKPRPGKAEAQFNRLEVEVNLEGSQEDVLTFLDGVFRMPRLLTIERLRLSANPIKGDLLRANLLINDLSLHGSGV